jgi:hypothetical protein
MMAALFVVLLDTRKVLRRCFDSDLQPNPAPVPPSAHPIATRHTPFRINRPRYLLDQAR